MFIKNFLAGTIDKYFSKPVEPPQPEPPAQTIAEIALGNENFETLVAALQATNGLDGLLNTALDPNAEKTTEAIENGLVLAKAAAALDSNNPAVLDNLAWAFFESGSSADALASARKAVEIAPESEKELYEGYLMRLERLLED